MHVQAKALTKRGSQNKISSKSLYEDASRRAAQLRKLREEARKEVPSSQRSSRKRLEKVAPGLMLNATPL